MVALNRYTTFRLSEGRRKTTLNLYVMPDDPNNPNGGGDTPPADTPPADNPPADENKGKQDMVPHEAMHAEREKRKAAEARIAELEKAEADRREAKMKEDSQYKELLEEKEGKLTEVTAQLEDVTKRLSAYEESAEKRISDTLEGIKKPEDKEFAEKLLEGRTLAEKENLLPGLLERFSSPTDLNKKPAGADTQTGGKSKQTLEELNTKMEEAVKAGRTMEAMKIQREIQALNSKD